MGVRTTLLAVTPLSTEVSTCAQSGQDLNGMLNMAAQGIADVIEILKAIEDFIPSGTNLTTIQSAVSSLT